MLDLSAAAGEVVTRPLEGVPGVTKFGDTSAKNEIGLDLFPVERAGAVMEFNCGATAVSVRGSVIVPVPANHMLEKATLKYSAAKGKQRPERFVGEPKDVLEASFNGGPFEQMGLAVKLTETNEEKVEVNSVA
jgi:hypothetical protein